MKKPMQNSKKPSILIVGTGAMACLFASLFAQWNINVSMLGSWKQAINNINKNGVKLTDLKKKTHAYHAFASDNPEDFVSAKVALVLVKSWQTKRAAEQLNTCLADDGVCITLQNGLGNDIILSSVLGKHRIIRGITTYGATIIEPGWIQLGGIGEIIIEKYPISPPLYDLLQQTNLPYKISEDIEKDIWEKLLINATINPLTAILDIQNGDLLKFPYTKRILKSIITEVIQVAHTQNINFSPDKQYKRVMSVLEMTSHNRSSMLQDIDRHAPTEIETINGAIVRLGEAKHINTPVNQSLVDLVKTIAQIRHSL
ncbi:MAG: 2-dehydropantoate 2-reductase [Anaerolineales bacterium]|nr:2-dehydropantoate 2-reductase [Anaerolineales bacterium]